jgi:adenylate cyclase
MVVPEKDFTGFVFNNSRNTLWLSLILVGLAAALGILLVRQGLQTDRTARQLAERSSAVDRQIRAFAGLARRPGFFDRSQDAPIQELSVVLADLGNARRASIWAISSNGRLLSCEDAYEREAAAHIAGLRIARSELPRFFAALESNDEIQVDDAATDRRTSELHRALMQPFGSRSLYVVSALGPEGVSGAIVLEDAVQLSEARDIAALAANMLAARLQRPADPPATAGTGFVETVPTSVGERSVTSELVEEVDTAAATGADVFPSVAVMAIHFDDDNAMAAHDVGAGTTVADCIFATLQDIASTHQIPYMKLVGNAVIAAAGLTPSDTAAVLRIADAAIAIREHCLEFFESKSKPPCFRVGVDCGVAIGSGVGRLPRVFNLWGKAVRTAAVMASTCAELGTIQVSEAVYHRLRQQFLFRVRGSFYLPGTGLSQTFILGGRP